MKKVGIIGTKIPEYNLNPGDRVAISPSDDAPKGQFRGYTAIWVDKTSKLQRKGWIRASELREILNVRA